jgi:hypothetical protein
MIGGQNSKCGRCKSDTRQIQLRLKVTRSAKPAKHQLLWGNTKPECRDRVKKYEAGDTTALQL